jgi:hypothetical protein
MFAIIAHLKETHGDTAVELEKTLLKVRAQIEKKMQLVDWLVAHNMGGGAQPLSDRSNRPTTAPPAATKPPAPAPAAEPPSEAKGPQRTPPRLPAPPRAVLPDAAALDLVEQFAGGRDHLTMSGSEMHGLVHWLKSLGKGEVEDELMKYKTLAEKKFQLCQYFVKHAAELHALAGGGGQGDAAPPPQHDELAATMPAAATAPPALMAAAPEPALSATMLMQAYEAPPQQQQQQQQQQQRDYAAEMYAPAEPAPPKDSRVLVQHAMLLGQTLDRMEETFNFQVDCMREDLKKAREQLHMLNAAITRR